MVDERPVSRAEFAIPMRDGVTLATDVYGLDESAGARPVILERTPYGKRATRTSDAIAANVPLPLPEQTAARFAGAGFILVRQDCRGRGASGGTFEKYVSEADDGEDTLAWIAAQPWCDGRIGTMGVSYSAHAQTAIAVRNPASLTAMVLDSGGFTNPFENGVRSGGAFELKQATWAMRHALQSVARRSEAQREQLEAVDIAAWFARMPSDPWRPGHSPLAAAPEYESYLFDQWSRDVLDSQWLDDAIHSSDSDERFRAVPTLMIGSWYDPYVRSVIQLFRRQGDHGARAHLVMGPWLHGMRAQTHAGDVEFGPAAAWDEALGIDYTESRIDWMRQAMTDASASDRGVTVFVMGGGSGVRNDEGRLQHGGQWREWSSWPPPEAESTILALGAEGSLSDGNPVTGTLELIADPAKPVPTFGGQITSGAPVMFGGGFDQNTNAPHEGVLQFRTEPLERAVTLAGGVALRVVLVPTTPDLDIAVKLIDEYPPSTDFPEGFALNVCDGIVRARYRTGFERKVPLEVGVETEIVVELPDTANTFAAGHRIRVDIAGSNFPHFDINPNHGGPPWQLPHAIARSAIVCDGRTRLEFDTVTL